jgi:hypothetical protein
MSYTYVPDVSSPLTITTTPPGLYYTDTPSTVYSVSQYPYVYNVVNPPTITVQQPTVWPIDNSLNMNLNPDVQNSMKDFFYYKTIDKWLYNEEDMLDLLNYLRVTDKGIDVLNKLDDYKETNINKDNQATVERKVDFIENNILSKSNVFKILKNYIAETNTNWFDLEKNSYQVKKIIKKYIRTKLINMIQAKMNK